MIKINHLTKDYGQQRGIFDLTFDVQRGEVFGFLGPNGAGKTTTIRHLMGFIHPNAGNCSINGLDCGTHSAEIQRNLGYMPGEIALPDDMTGIDFLHFARINTARYIFFKSPAGGMGIKIQIFTFWGHCFRQWKSHKLWIVKILIQNMKCAAKIIVAYMC